MNDSILYMQLQFNTDLAKGYKSPSQIARVLTEGWVKQSSYCPNCGRIDITKYGNNNPASDFYCENCSEDYELKSKRDSIGNKIMDGAYETMVAKLKSSRNPNFFLLNYNIPKYEVINFLVIPKHFFVPEIIEKRKPLSKSADRHDWVGCNILLQTIPQTGKIFLVRDGKVEPKEKVLLTWQKTLFLREEKEISAKGWLLDIMKFVEKIGKPQFSLDDVYLFEKELAVLHPDNKHIKEKIRQQLQVLRDKNYLKFLGQGKYQLT